MQVTIEQAVKKPVDLHEAEGLFPCHHIGSRIGVACAEIRDLSACGNQFMRCAECQSTKVCLDPLQRGTSPAAGYILLLGDTLRQEMRGWLRCPPPFLFTRSTPFAELA